MVATTQIFTEIFPVNISEIPALSAYRLDTRGSDASIIAGILCYRLKLSFNGQWVWTGNRIVTDMPASVEDIYKVVEQLWKEQPDTFKSLRGVEKDAAWALAPEAAADFVIMGPLRDVDRDIRALLDKESPDLGEIRVERGYEIKGWVVDDRPAISISINSSLIYNRDLRTYAGQLHNWNEVIGLQVAAKASSLKGEIIGIAGIAGEPRQRLVSLTSDERTREILRNAENGEPIVEVLTPCQKLYECPLGSLRIIVRAADFTRFKVNAWQALGIMRIKPALRDQLVSLISNAGKGKNLIGTSYNSQDHPGQFLDGSSLKFNPDIQLGKNHVCEYNEKNILEKLKIYGPYKKVSKFNSSPIKIGIINSTTRSTDAFRSSVQFELKELGYTSIFVMEERVDSDSPIGLRRCFEERIKKYEKTIPHVLLLIIPDHDEYTGIYRIFKSIAIGKGIPGQAVKESAMDNKFAMADIILGILGKTGNVPYVLENSIPYADIIVGIDVARERKRRLALSANATVISRIYFSNGELFKYMIRDAPLKGETIPDQVIQSLFPPKEFKGKKVIVHRNGFFRGNEKQALKEWAKKIGAQFYLVEIIKSRSPRIYAANNGCALMPPRGSAFKANEHEALLVSSSPPFQDAAPQPLHIKTETPLTIEQALNSVLMLTALHYGSSWPPRLPVTIYYGDKIAFLALRGIKPKNLEGNIPFWL